MSYNLVSYFFLYFCVCIDFKHLSCELFLLVRFNLMVPLRNCILFTVDVLFPPLFFHLLPPFPSSVFPCSSSSSSLQRPLRRRVFCSGARGRRPPTRMSTYRTSTSGNVCLQTLMHLMTSLCTSFRLKPLFIYFFLVEGKWGCMGFVS